MVMIRPGTIFILRRLSNHSTVQRKRNKNMNPDFLFVCPPFITMQDVGTGFCAFIYIETTIRYTAEIGNTCLLFYENTTLVSGTIRYEWLLWNIHNRDGNERRLKWPCKLNGFSWKKLRCGPLFTKRTGARSRVFESRSQAICIKTFRIALKFDVHPAAALPKCSSNFRAIRCRHIFIICTVFLAC